MNKDGEYVCDDCGKRLCIIAYEDAAGSPVWGHDDNDPCEPEKAVAVDEKTVDVKGKPRVVLGIPTQGWIHHVLAAQLPDLARHPLYEIVFITLNERPIEHARNKLVKIMLDMQAAWLLMIDADNPPMRNPLDLIPLDKDILACPTPMYKRLLSRGGVYWNTGMDTSEGWNTGTDMPKGKIRIDGIHKGNELERRDIVGTGCILIRRNVLEAVRPAFIRDYDKDGLTHVSSDYTFCRRARAQGFEVWAHYGHPCRHICEVEVSEITCLDYATDLAAGLKACDGRQEKGAG